MRAFFRKESNFGGRRGFTLLEAILAIVVIGVTVVAVADIMVKGMASYGLIVDRREALQQARLAVNMMSQELETIADPASDILSIAPDSIQFKGVGGGQVAYKIGGGQIRRMTGTSDNQLASNVTEKTVLEYFTKGGAPTTDPAQVHRIDITVDIDAGASGTVQAKSGVYLRNRYYKAFTRL